MLKLFYGNNFLGVFGANWRYPPNRYLRFCAEVRAPRCDKRSSQLKYARYCAATLHIKCTKCAHLAALHAAPPKVRQIAFFPKFQRPWTLPPALLDSFSTKKSQKMPQKRTHFVPTAGWSLQRAKRAPKSLDGKAERSEAERATNRTKALARRPVAKRPVPSSSRYTPWRE